ncbi:MAG TPA: endonuclease domain-containing protein [Pseudorhizobium sp.]|jgi:very-short-patch-repair endonuclease|nr:endonuclease domain-containing protein [Pseudorhizobium sp.]
MRHQPPPINRGRARGMRRDPTRAEDMLWEALRDRRLDGAKFRRQVPLERYILDFVCFERRLIVEVDGWQHADNRADGIRDTFFRSQGFRVLRFWNEEVEENINAVCLRILAELRDGDE